MKAAGVSRPDPGWIQIGVAFFALGFNALGIADNFDDPGNLYGKFRTDYEDEDEGTSSNDELQIGSTCYFEDAYPDDPILIMVGSQACPDSPTVYYGTSFYFSNLSSSTQTPFWVISGNVEPSFSTTTLLDDDLDSIQGPPSLSTNLDGNPFLLQFYMLGIPPVGSPDKFEANLILDNEGSSHEKFVGAWPFLSIGAQKNHGNSGRVGAMNEQYALHKTTWISTLRMVNYESGNEANNGAHYAIAVAKWGGKLRMIQIALYHYNLEYSNSQNAGVHHHWNWTAENSVWYPGADIVFADVEDLNTHCGSGVGTVPEILLTNHAYTYLLDWEVTFECMSSEGLFDMAMPTSTSVNILGVHWAIEAVGNTSMWVAVSDMGMVQ